MCRLEALAKRIGLASFYVCFGVLFAQLAAWQACAVRCCVVTLCFVIGVFVMQLLCAIVSTRVMLHVFSPQTFLI